MEMRESHAGLFESGRQFSCLSRSAVTEAPREVFVNQGREPTGGECVWVVFRDENDTEFRCQPTDEFDHEHLDATCLGNRVLHANRDAGF